MPLIFISHTGEMMVSPLSVVSTAKHGCYNNEAVTRLLLDNQDGSLLEDEDLSQLPDNSNEASCHDIIPEVEIPSDIQTEEEEADPEALVKTPKTESSTILVPHWSQATHEDTQTEGRTIEDLRGKLLKTPQGM